MAAEKEASAPSEEQAAFRRIETLIPYKDPEFKPKASMGKLNLSSSVWAISAKLGRYLLSGCEPESRNEVARVVAEYFTDAQPGGLEAVSPEEVPPLAASIISENVTGSYSVFRALDSEETVVVAHDKAKSRGLGSHSWSYRSRPARAQLNIMKLPCALGLMEIVEQGGGKEALRVRCRAAARAGYLKDAETFRRLFREWEAEGRVRYADPEPTSAGKTRRTAWAMVDLSPDRNELHFIYLYDDDRLMAEGSREELEAQAETLAESAFGRYDPRRLLQILSEQKRSDQGPLGLALKKLAEDRWDEEACREANRRWGRSPHIAGVFEDKKHCDDAHREAAASGYLAGCFRHVEVDDAVDLDAYRELVDEFEARDRAGEIPGVTKGDHALRFRKCGRHRAIGVYSPLHRAVAVDPRAPRSLLHEFAHAYDFEHGQLSTAPEFKPLLSAFRREMDTGDMTERQAEYYATPTEVFARAWESYAALNGFGGSFVNKLEDYISDPAYTPLLEHAKDVNEYFDGFARPREAARVVDAQERAVETVRSGGDREFAELRWAVAEGRVDVFRLREDLGGGMALPAEAERRMGELMAASLLAPAAVADEPRRPGETDRRTDAQKGQEDEPVGGQMSLF